MITEKKVRKTRRFLPHTVFVLLLLAASAPLSLLVTAPFLGPEAAEAKLQLALLSNGDFEADPVGTTGSDITGWTLDAYNQSDYGTRGTSPGGVHELAISGARYFSGTKSVYSRAQNVAGGGPTDADGRHTISDLITEAPITTTASRFTFWRTDVSYTTSDRWFWRFDVEISDGTTTQSIGLACRAWGLSEGCTGNFQDHSDQAATGADGQTWYRHAIDIPLGMDKSNLTVKIRHQQDSWDGTTAESSLYYDLFAGVVAQTSPFTVTREDDPAPDGCNVGDCSLREAIIAANGHAGEDLIDVLAGTYILTIAGAGENFSATGDLDITDDITIMGAGAAVTVIDGNGSVTGDRVFHIPSAGVAVEISGVSITGGRAPAGSGGGGINNAGDIILSDVIVTQNTAGVPADSTSTMGASGGGISNSSTGTLNISDSTISDNTAFRNGGGMTNSGISDLAGVTVTNNTAGIPGAAPGGIGGGIVNFRTGTLNVTDSTISNNIAYRRSGGLHNEGSATVDTTTITQNIAGVSGDTTVDHANGGGINNYGYDTVHPILNINNSVITNNIAHRIGGGIRNGNGTLTITGSVISDNIADLYSGGIDNFHGSSLTVISTTISDNAGGDLGGGIAHYGVSLDIQDSTISGNAAVQGGGIIACCTESTATITNTTISGNSASTQGGGLANVTSLSLNNSTISTNTARDGGGIYNAGSVGVTNTIVANSPSGGDCSGVITSNGHNLSSDATCGFTAAGDLQNTDPLLGPLQDNGGATETHALLPGSPAIDAGNDATCPGSDQRGEPRPIDGDGDGLAVCDIGAYEAPTTVDESAMITWSTSTLSQPRGQFAAATVGTKALFAGGLDPDFSNAVDIYDSQTGVWSTATLSQARSVPVGASVGTKALFGGGATDGGPSAVVDIYDSQAGAWSTVSLSQARQFLAATAVGAKAIFAGGYDKDGIPSTVVDIYDSETGAWSTASLSQARSSLAATTVGSKAIFAGGNPGGGYSTVVDIYDNETGTWSTASLSQPRFGLRATTVGSKALFAGGQTPAASDVVDIYDNGTGAWSVASLSQARNDPAATSLGIYALFAGGEALFATSGVLVDTVDIYNSETGAWRTASLSQARKDLAATTVGTKALFAGGYDGTAVKAIVDIAQTAVDKHLAFTTQPIRGGDGIVLGYQPVVAVTNADGNVLVGDNITEVTLTLVGGPADIFHCTQTSGGDTALVVQSGEAHFSRCIIEEPGVGYVLEAFAPGITAAFTDPFNITLAGDVNFDCRVGVLDFSTVVNHYGKNSTHPDWLDPAIKAFRADINGDGRVSVIDFSIVVSRYGRSAAVCAPAKEGNWTVQTSGTTENLYDVDAVDSMTAWAVGDNGTILKTTNGGATWTPQVSGTTEQLLHVAAVNAATAWAIGYNIILKTTDGGATWVPQTSGTLYPLEGLAAIDANTAWVVGGVATVYSSNQVIIKTTDGGATWVPQSSGTTAPLRDLSAVDANTAWAVGWTGIILKTTDGGATWTDRSTSLETFDLYSVAAVDANTAWAVRHTYEILKTSDGGATWAVQKSDSMCLCDISEVDAVDTNTAWATGGGVIKTSDGVTWSQQPVSISANGVAAVDTSTAWAVGASGTISKYGG